MNERQLGRLKRLADWLHGHDRKFLFELLVPATDATARSRSAATPTATTPSSTGADAPRDRGDPGLRDRGRRLEDRGRRRARATPRRSPSRRAPGEGRDERDAACCSVAAPQPRRSSTGSTAGGRRRWLHRLRDRPLDLVGRAQGLPRQASSSARARPAQIADNYLHFVEVYEGDARSLRTGRLLRGRSAPGATRGRAPYARGHARPGTSSHRVRQRCGCVGCGHGGDEDLRASADGAASCGSSTATRCNVDARPQGRSASRASTRRRRSSPTQVRVLGERRARSGARSTGVGALVFALERATVRAAARLCLPLVGQLFVNRS